MKPLPIVGPKSLEDDYVVRTLLNRWNGEVKQDDIEKAIQRVYASHKAVEKIHLAHPMIRFGDALHFIISKIGTPRGMQKSLRIQYDDRNGMSNEDYAMTYNFMMDAKIIRFDNVFSNIIRDTNAPAFDYIHVVKPVFPIVFAEYDGGIYVDDFDARINSMLIVCLLVTPENIEQEGLSETVMPGYRFGTYGIGYDGKEGHIPVDLYSMARVYDMEGNLAEGTLQWTGMLAVARATLDMLSSPSTRLDDVNISKINKARQKKNQSPLLPWKTIRWSDKTRPSEGTGTGFKHGVRYDVRGNWATFTKGRLAGRMIWRRPHQRGVDNLEYNPKTYQVKS